MGASEVLETLHFNQSKSAVLVELVGTFLLTLTVSLASHENGELAPLAGGFMLMALVFAFGYISGGHFNPAVTFAAFTCERCDDDIEPFPWYKAVLYAIAQLAGAAGAGVYMLFIVGWDFPVPETPNTPLEVVRGFFAESVYTFVLASVVLHVALSSQRKNDFYGFAIGMAVMSAALAVGGVSGGAFNPALATGLIVIKCFVGARCTAMRHLWLYWAGELVGSFVAVVLFNSVTIAMRNGNTAASKPAAPADERELESKKSEAAATAASAAANTTGAEARDERESPAPVPNDSTSLGGGSPAQTPSKLDDNRPAPIAVPQPAAAPAAQQGIKIRPMPTTAQPAAPAAAATKQETATPTKGNSPSPSPRAPDNKTAAPLPPPQESEKKNADDVSPLEVDDDDDAR